MIAPGSAQRLPTERSFRLKLALAFAVIYVVYGSTYLAIRYSVETIPPLVSAGIRLLVAGCFMFAWAWSRGVRPQRKHWMAGVVLGALYFLLSHGLLYWAEQTVPSGLVALLVATEPVFILLLSWLLAQQKIGGLSILGLSFGMLGVGLLMGAEPSINRLSLMRLAAALLASVSWAAGVVVSPRLRLPEDALMRAAIPVLCGAVMLLAVAGVASEFQSMQWSGVSARSLLGLGYLIMFGSVLAFTSYTWLLQNCPPTLVATHTYANPVVAVLLGWLFADEPLNARLLWAFVMILGAIVSIRLGQGQGAGTTAADVSNIANVRPILIRRANDTMF